MSHKFALFPLQLVVFPGENLNLHIFEPRYRQLVEDAEQEGITWLIPTVIDGNIQPMTTEVSLQIVAHRYPGGESDVRTIGQNVFQLLDFWERHPGKLYPGGVAKRMDIDFNEDPALNQLIVGLTEDIFRLLHIEKPIKSVEDGFRTYDVGHYVGLTLRQEYHLLTLLDATARQEYLLAHLRGIQPQADQNSNIKRRAELNGHFQHLRPPRW
ncbi:peptidase [Neolewinella lacunae]|uniref:Peptidase n=1 Tax=Neolewinella lacunae TaxID=1517758 RepID=A0A923PMR7_9BACT|nr:peptidase [Neolewinella lacunae]MBC6995270.1 peptidase [Neolewinella lacunae]MDN3635561.1 peptidase [Neolewinella lacunae]